MQDRDQTVTGLTQKLADIEEELELWKGKIEKNKIESFTILNLLLEERNLKFLTDKLLLRNIGEN
jgi:hypothetical protein